MIRNYISIFFILLSSFNLNASEFYNILNKSSPSMMDFGLLKIELEIEREKGNIIKRFKEHIKNNLITRWQQSKFYDFKNFDFKNNLVILIDERELRYSGSFNHDKNKLILELNVHLDVSSFLYKEFFTENYDAIESKELCNEIREQLQLKLGVYGIGPRAKNYFFNRFFANTGKQWKEELIGNENTNLVVLLHWDFWLDDIEGRRTTVCLGDIASNSFYKEYEFYLINNIEEHIEFLESL